MSLTIAAIRSGTDPQGALPPGAFQRTLDDQLACPKCNVVYNLIADFDETNDRFFPEASRPLVLLLKKAVFMGHGDGHRVTHFETSGVIVRAIGPSASAKRPAAQRPGRVH